MIELFQPLRTFTLHIPGTGPAHNPDKAHLFVILTNTCKDGKNLLVPICSERPKCDRTCLLGAGDHPFLNRLSFVSYAQLAQYDAEHIKNQVLSKVIEYKGIMDAVIFARVCAGVEVSPLAAPKYVNYFLSQRGA